MDRFLSTGDIVRLSKISQGREGGYMTVLSQSLRLRFGVGPQDAVNIICAPTGMTRKTTSTLSATLIQRPFAELSVDSERGGGHYIYIYININYIFTNLYDAPPRGGGGHKADRWIRQARISRSYGFDVYFSQHINIYI